MAGSHHILQINNYFESFNFHETKGKTNDDDGGGNNCVVRSCEACTHTLSHSVDALRMNE